MGAPNEVAASFPSQGIDATCEFGRQPADTAPDATNVLSFDLLASRRRGGSRWGLSKYLSSPLVSDSSPVQHLALLVDPQSPALSTENTFTPTDGFELDPSTNNTRDRVAPGLYVRTGGSAKRPRKRPNTSSPQPDGTYSGLIGQVEFGDGFATLSFLFGALGNGEYSGLTYTIEVRIAPPVAVPPPGTEAMTWFVSSEAYDALAVGNITVALSQVSGAATRVFEASITPV